MKAASKTELAHRLVEFTRQNPGVMNKEVVRTAMRIDFATTKGKALVRLEETAERFGRCARTVQDVVYGK
jgi:hypothetical protein